MTKRPVLDISLDSKTFREFYYLKSELVDFCRENGLPTSGGKLDITDRIACFLESGTRLSFPSGGKKPVVTCSINEDSIIEPNFVCSETHRAFFKEHIGGSFSFNVAFQKWLKSNTGKTYKDALLAYDEIVKDKKKGKTAIDRQFEYNTYIRDFFADNKGRSLEDAIKCWKHKKQFQGHHRYERSDLEALERV